MKRRNTPAKQAIFSLLEESKTALSQDAIEQKLAGQMDRVTIYRVLHSFCEDGLTHRITSDDGKYYFALCRKCNGKHHLHNHFHFRCLQCGKVECLKEEVEVTVPNGYTLENANCWLSGYCKDCS
ncbi:MAG TPA: transcriptional repressor [Patescibacteria group bacterium]|nr:transcriptional repressor [Patescibacteria group bacterium]